MANPHRHFQVTDASAIQAQVAAHPFATLVVAHGGAQHVNHVPLQLDATLGPYGTLVGHVARANGLWRLLPQTGAVAVFHGPQAYVSPSWYPSKAEHGKAVPTWNYAVVHAHGTLRALHDPERLRALVTALTDAHEAHRPVPWRVDDAPQGFIDAMLAGIVGITLEVQRWEAIAKLGQNRSAADQAGVRAGLRAEGHPDAQATADAMERLRPEADD